MSQLIVVGFKQDIYRATQVLNHLIELNDEWVVDLSDAVAVYRDYNGELTIDQSYQLTPTEGATWGGLWGSLVGMTLATIAIPATGGASVLVAAGALTAGSLGGGALGAMSGAINADWWKTEFGISEEFVHEIGTLVQPGDSAIYALVRTLDTTYVTEQLRGQGGTVLHSTLSDEQAKLLQSLLDGTDQVEIPQPTPHVEEPSVEEPKVEEPKMEQPVSDGTEQVVVAQAAVSQEENKTEESKTTQPAPVVVAEVPAV